MEKRIAAVRQGFETNVDSVIELMEFDHVVLDFAIGQLEKLVKARSESFANPIITGENSLQALRNVRQNDSLRSQYETIYNQCLVLLVSHFGSGLQELFRVAAYDRIMWFEGQSDSKDELKVTLGELRRVVRDPQGQLGELVISKKDFSFQDMQSTSRAFSDYLKCQVPRGEDVNDIIVAQACRHVIVHAGGKVDGRLVAQVAGASPRRLRPDLRRGEVLRFSPDEVKAVAAAMRSYLASLCDQLVPSAMAGAGVVEDSGGEMAG